ncbi:d-xylulose 5-phosphate d-fructose 6-phosphate [Colletotrichum plurivorum]|uniref:D-xylulose 5-phosphate d-fructose 6-phosphate n=1 Tax=Colletotrichum plurivorum TaxID=2175906 RepID=A0A8H6NCQ7_9PEZI|nr:d-xylulose 5-phosphate d-fructose 6-phosphate [Colletotrichum plurivorum]
METPAEDVGELNSPPVPSLLSDDVLRKTVKIDKKPLAPEVLKSLHDYQNAACYLSLAMCLLQGNPLLDGLIVDKHKHESFDRIIDRWKTCPILILVWSHLNLLIRNYEKYGKHLHLDMIFAIGPGYGVPATLAALWLDGSLQKLLPQMAHGTDGLANIIAKFSVPNGFSHTSSERDNELDYALDESKQAVYQKRSLIVPCIISTRGSWNAGPWKDLKLISPQRFQVCAINGLEDVDMNLSNALEWAGHAYPENMDGAIMKSQQLPLATDRNSQSHFATLGEWDHEYNIASLLADSKPNASILEAIPQDDAKKLRLLKAKDPHVVDPLIGPGSLHARQGVPADHSEMVPNLLGEMMKVTPGRFQIISSILESLKESETDRTKLVAVLECENRDLQRDDYSGATRGRPIQFVLEIGIRDYTRSLHDAMVEYARFTKVARQMRWKWERASMNFIEMHPLADESLTLITKVLGIKGAATQVYFPPDSNCLLSTVDYCLRSRDSINLVMGSKQPIATYFDEKSSREHIERGFNNWLVSPTHNSSWPDAVLVGIGVEMTFEVVKAAELLQELAPELRVRVVNVSELTVICPEGKHPRAMSFQTFKATFTAKKDILFYYPVMGYSKENLLGTPFGRMLLNSVSRFDVAIQELKAGTVISSRHLDKTSLGGKIKAVEKGGERLHRQARKRPG